RDRAPDQESDFDQAPEVLPLYVELHIAQGLARVAHAVFSKIFDERGLGAQVEGEPGNPERIEGGLPQTVGLGKRLHAAGQERLQREVGSDQEQHGREQREQARQRPGEAGARPGGLLARVRAARADLGEEALRRIGAGTAATARETIQEERERPQGGAADRDYSARARSQERRVLPVAESRRGAARSRA